MPTVPPVLEKTLVCRLHSLLCVGNTVNISYIKQAGVSMSDILRMLKRGDSDCNVNTFVNKHFSGVGKHAVSDSQFIIHQIAKEMNKALQK